MSSNLQENSYAAEPSLEVSRARPLLGTLVQIRASGPRGRIQSAVDAAFATIERLHECLSYQNPDSELSALNRQRLFVAQPVHADIHTVLCAALHFARLSEGAFDPCVGYELERWGVLPGHDAPQPRAGSRRGSWRDIELLPDQHVCLHGRVRIDLGGIAKGYAVDQAVQALVSGGVSDVLVNAGGDLRVAGPRVQQIALRHPLTPACSSESVTLRDAALATSAAYFSRRSHPQGEVSALLDPLSRAPYLGPGSISVRAASCMSADALSKVVLFAPPHVAEHALATCDAMAFVQRPFMTDSLPYSYERPANLSVTAHAR